MRTRINIISATTKFKKMNPVILPINIHYKANIGSGAEIDIKITNPIIKYSTNR